MNMYSRTTILSAILGDGHLDKNGGIQVKHAERYLDYVQWKASFYKKAGLKVSEIRSLPNSGYPGYGFYISTTSWGKFLRAKIWKDSQKDFYKRKFLNRLSAEHIALWYMDDGGLSQCMKRGRLTGNELMLNTHTDRETNQIIIDYFKEVWNVNFSQCKNGQFYRLRCGTKEARKFVDIVREYVIQIPSMYHKINVKPI